MHQMIASPLLDHWTSFYAMVGSAAAALSGLQYVVIALFTQMRLLNTSAGIDTFSTPTIVYFSTVLLIAALLCIPWNGLAILAVLIALSGAVGTFYAALVARRATRQSEYRLVLEDWLWHISFPLVAHLLLLAAGLTLVRQPGGALVAIASATLILLLVGIHNAWDTVTYVVMQRLPANPPAEAESPQRQEAAAPPQPPAT